MNIIEVVKLAEGARLPNGNPFMLYARTSVRYDGGIYRVGTGFKFAALLDVSLDVRSVKAGFAVLGWCDIGEFTVVLHSASGDSPNHKEPFSIARMFKMSVEPVRFAEVRG